ncbi:MAG: multiheme c-type cytochrome [Planctomycetaceae bacterium]
MSHVQPALIAVLPLAWLACAAAAEPPPRAHLGVSSCASAGCHAAAEAGHARWQSSFTVWAMRDPHAQAHRALEGPRAERLIAAIAIRAGGRPQPPATEHPACVACHAPAPGAAMREGVGCESCHGAAGDWVVAHALPGWKTGANAAGMIDLSDPETCARTCTPCHVGGPPRADGAPFEVSHDLIAAGHPRLAFELRSFKAGTPPHWRDRVALAAAGTIPAAGVDPVGEWATGRMVVLEAYLDRVARQSATAAGASGGLLADTWPELSAFDCYGCHRRALAAADRGQPVAASRGRIRLEPLVWSLIDVAAPDAGAELTALRSDIERGWWLPPDADRLRGAMGRVAATVRDGRMGDAALVRQAVERAVATTDPANWDEVVALATMLEAVVDDHRVKGPPGEGAATAAAAIADLRRLIAFEAQGSGAGRVRFNSPHGHDPAAIREAIAAAADRVRELSAPHPLVPSRPR